MKIISRIEINYFRSVYSTTISNISDLNVFMGGNDAGKSNVLRALNLFFNNQTDLNSPFSFSSDLCKVREAEARAAKGRAFLWIKITFNNYEKWSSLPDTFYVKKSWNRYSPQPEISIPKGINQQNISKFLNKVNFKYIPAVRGRDIFRYFLSLLHDSLYEGEANEINDAATTLSNEINNSTEEMSRRIKDGLGFQSTIQAPPDLRMLFSALDFSTKFSDHDIPLQMRGDGIQARHIPFILDFISRESKQNYIWAYEEPENSLEMSRCFELADQFSSDFCNHNQIFITTHSPAFYDIENEKSRRYIVTSERHGDTSQYVSEVRALKNVEELDDDLGIAPLIASRARGLYEDISTLRERNSQLNERLQAAESPILLVEGDTDVRILAIAFSKLYGDEFDQLIILPSGGASGITSFIRSLAAHNAHAEGLFGLWDHDRAGRVEFGKFANRQNVGDNHVKRVSPTHQVFCAQYILPDEYIAISGNSFLAVPVEFMFPPDVVVRAEQEHALLLQDRVGEAGDHEYRFQINVTDQKAQGAPADFRYLFQKVDDSCKNRFSEWVRDLNADDFRYFRPTLDRVLDAFNLLPW